MNKTVVMTPADIRRSLARIAHEIIERNKSAEDLVIVGMRTRGAPLARRLADNLESLDKFKIPVGVLDISNYRDDISLPHRHASPQRTEIPIGIDGKSIILVDDVLYTGRSARAAMDALIDIGRPRSIQLAVLIDRGHRELPIRADYVGKNIPTSQYEEIRVRLIETDETDEVIIVKLTGPVHPGGQQEETQEKR